VANYERPERPEDDNYPTPDWAVGALVPMLPPQVIESEVWEPACGQGHLADSLKARGFDVTSSTLVDYGYGAAGVDFLKVPTLKAPTIITNPPYKHAEAFVRHALDLKPKVVAMLLRAQFLGGAKRSRWMRTTPLKRVVYLTSRVTMYPHGVRPEGGGTATHDSIWLIWMPGWPYTPTFHWADKDA